MTLAMVSLAGIPPLAGFFGKFLLLKSVIAQAAVNPGFYCLTFVTLAGVAISLYYYFGVIRVMYWSAGVDDRTPVPVSRPIRLAIGGCIAGMLWLGLFPGPVWNLAAEAAKALKF
jgi:NADH-quinone oxidoreductase subunit N